MIARLRKPMSSIVDLRSLDLPYTLRLYEVSEELFDELVDEDTKAELIDGVMIVHSPASPKHNRIATFLRHLMDIYVQERGRGGVFGPDDLLHLATCRKFMPDGFFLKNVPRPLPAKEFVGTPNLVIEVLSPSNRDVDLKDKRPAYQEAGVSEIWFIDPVHELLIIDRKRGRRYATLEVSTGKVTSTVVKGFWIEVEWLWRTPTPKMLACLNKIMA
jgi:Uma2 family endonuclease